MPNNESAVSSAFHQSFSGFDFVGIGKAFLFWTYYLNDLIVRLITAIMKLIRLPYTDYHATVILVILYMILLYYVLSIADKFKPLIKYSIIVGVIWLFIGFFKF